MDISDTFLAELRLNSEFNIILARGELYAPLLPPPPFSDLHLCLTIHIVDETEPQKRIGQSRSCVAPTTTHTAGS
jgi:hypothetical protein